MKGTSERVSIERGDGLGGPLENAAAREQTEESAAADATCEGQITVYDLTGAAVAADKGYIDWEPWTMPQGEEQSRSAIRASMWSVNARGGAELAVKRCLVSFDGRTYEAIPRNRVVKPDPSVLCVLEVDLEPGVVLRVVDAQSGLDVDGVEVVLVRASRDLYGETFQEPPESLLLGKPMLDDSPLRIPRMTSVVTGWTRAEGYGWKRFAFAPESESVIVELELGGDLVVEIPGSDARSKGNVVVVYYAEVLRWGRAVEAPLALRKVGAGEEVAFHGLEPGTKLFVGLSPNANVAGAIGPWLAAKHVVLVPSETTRIVLDPDSAANRGALDDIDVRVAAPVMDVVGTREANIFLEPVGSGASAGSWPSGLTRHYSEALRTASGDHVFEIRGVPPGRYGVCLQPLGIEQTFDVGAGERATVDFGEAIELVDVTIDFVRHNGKPLKRAEVIVRPPMMRAPGSWAQVGRTNSSGVVGPFKWPTGGLVAHVQSGGGGDIYELTVSRAQRALHVELGPSPRKELAVAVVRDGEPVVLPGVFWGGIAADRIGEGEGKLFLCMPTGAQAGGYGGVMSFAGATLVFDHPGEYQLSFPAVPGMPTFAPRNVTVPAEGAGECRVVW